MHVFQLLNVVIIRDKSFGINGGKYTGILIVYLYMKTLKYISKYEYKISKLCFYVKRS